MKEMRYLITGILLVGMAMALQVNVVNPLTTVSQGQVANFQVEITNPGMPQNVFVTTDSGVQVAVSEPVFYIGPGESKTINVFAVTNGLAEDTFLITLNVDGVDYYLALNVVGEDSPVLLFDSVYDEVTATQDEFQDLKFLIRNEGEDRLRNIVVEGDIPSHLSPVYPGVFDLKPNEVKEVIVKITVPTDYPSDDYEFFVKAGCGNLVVQDKVVLSVEGRDPLSDRLEVKLLLPWEVLKEDGKVLGYKLNVRVTNRGISDVNNIRWLFEGMPDEWEVSGDDTFGIQGYETKDIELRVVPTDFNEQVVNVTLMRGDEQITKEKVTFAGYKIGEGPTGMFLFGGSALIGIVIVVALVIALLYIRGRVAEDDAVEEKKTRSYLEKLVEKAKEEQKARKK